MTLDASIDAGMAGQRKMSPAGGRIGILTFHRCINYGSYWQARCLVEGVRSLGVDAVLLDHHDDRVARAEVRCAFRPTLPSHTPRTDFPAYARKTRAFHRAIDRLPLSKPFPLHEPHEAPACERIIIGSDEVWNLDHPWYGGSPIFYGHGVRAPVLAYAASFGNQDAARGLSSPWKHHLGAFTSLSVRDENSRRIVNDALGHDPEIVLDPCLLFPPKTVQCASQSDHPYIAIYGHNFPAWLSEHVRSNARQQGYRLVSIGYRNDWADEQRLSASPDQFADLIARSQAVVTNFFHGCVFALIHRRPFVTAPTAYRSNKIHGLMDSLGISAAIVTENSDQRTYASLLEEPADVGVRLHRLRQTSLRYLRQALDLTP